MAPFIQGIRVSVVLTFLLSCLLVYPSFMMADESAVKMVKLEGSIDRTGPGPIFPFALTGIASHLGKFTGLGEVAFAPGTLPESEIGTGVVVFFAADGDQLVGLATWNLAPSEDNTHDTSIHFAWRDSVTLSNGTVVRNTGRFVTDRPPGLVVTGQTVCVRIPFTNKYVCTIVYR